MQTAKQWHPHQDAACNATAAARVYLDAADLVRIYAYQGKKYAQTCAWTVAT